MELNQFVQLFAEQFEDTDASVFTPETNYHDLDEWGSLTALSIISMVDDEFDKQVTGAELRSIETIEELYTLIMSK